MKYFLLIILLIMVTPLMSVEKKIVLLTGEWPPYTSENMEKKGFFSEIITAVFSEMKLEVEYKFWPWKRCEESVRSGDFFAAFPYKETDERKKEFSFSDAVVNSTGRFFYNVNFLNDVVKFEKLEDLKLYKIGGSLGYWYEKDFKSAGLNVRYAPEDRDNMKLLQAGMIQLFPMDELGGRELIKKLFPNEINNFKVLGKPLNSDALRLMISQKYKDHKELMDRFNKGLASIKAKGIYSKILKKYNIKE